MTLEDRLLRRLRNWQAAARQHRQAMDELDEEIDKNEWWMHKVEAEVFERCISELAVDLSAPREPALKRLRTAANGEPP